MNMAKPNIWVLKKAQWDLQKTNSSEWLPTQGVTDTLPIEAWFPPIEYQFNAVADPPEGGTVSGGGTAKYGESVLFMASPNESYTFEGWYYGEENMSGSPSFTLDTASFLDTHTIPVTSTENSFTFTAKFDLDVPDTVTVDLRAEPPEGGQVSGGGEFPKGSSTIISAVPNSGYEFSGWYYDPCGTPFSDSQTLTLSNLQFDLALFASFHKP